MEGIEELRAKAIASMKGSGSSNPILQGKPDELGKEMGVPSNEDVPPFSGTLSSLDSSVKTLHPYLRHRQKKKLRSGNYSLWNSSSSLLASTSQRMTLMNHNKGDLQNKSPSNDLIISFSDDGDTDSELENLNSRRKVNFKGNKEKHIHASNPKEQNLQPRASSHRRIVPKKTSSGTTSRSLYNKFQGFSINTIAENRILAQRIDSTVKTISHKETGQLSDINVTEDKLRSLREQIALRENVLRLQKTAISANKDLDLAANAQVQSSFGGSSVNKESNHSKHDGQLLEISCNMGIENRAVAQLCDEPVSEKTSELEDQCAIVSHQLQVKEHEPSAVELNNSNQLGTPEETMLDREEILHLEELYGNELEEAREYRRKCELEEMQALRAYRKAREALLAANNRCSFLYRKREMVSLLASKWAEPGNDFSNASTGLLTDGDSLMENNLVLVGGKKTTGTEPKRASFPNVQDLELEACLRKKLMSKSVVRSLLKCPDETSNTNGMIVNHVEIYNGDGKCSAPAPILKAPSQPSEILGESSGNLEGSEIPGSEHQEVDVSYVQVNHSPTQVTVLSVNSCLQFVARHLNFFPTKAVNSHIGHIDTTLRKNVDSQNVDSLLDPFWPICMFELRGKCNDDECPWQHLQYQNQQKIKPAVSLTVFSDNQVETRGKFNSVHQLPHTFLHYNVSIPTYSVGSYMIEADMLLYQSVLAFCSHQYWDIGFCASVLLPLAVHRVFPSYIPFLYASDAHLTSSDDWIKTSLYFSCEADGTKKMKQGFNSPEQTLEIIRSLLNGRMSNKALRNEVLSLLSRALEMNPNSVILWMVYLHIYYMKAKSIGEDDMFSYAVKFNQNSYELWHLYISSRMHFGDRMSAYNEALSSFCQLAKSHQIEDSTYISSCILDLSLQMINSLCMHGDVDDAISRLSELIHHGASLKNPYSTHPSDILSCLTSSDRCVLWICCLYLMIYEMLPEGIIRKLEFEKVPSLLIEWPPADLSSERKSKVLEFLEKLVNAEKSTHFLAVNHIKCLAAIYGGLNSSSSGLLTEYLRMHPTCVDLILISFCLEGSRLTYIVEHGLFKGVLDKWLTDFPGSQCLWNRCAALLLSHRKFEDAEALMESWFDHFCRNLGTEELTLTLTSLFCHKHNLVFGLLNLGLYKLMQRKKEEAYQAVDQALDLSTEEEYSDCVREHAVMSSISLPSSAAVINLLNRYVSDPRSNSARDLLTRRVLTTLKKSNLKYRVTNFLGPVSFDFSLLNSILETLYGPSLIPDTFDEAKEMVDFVEPLMEIAPSNHRLAVSACESLFKDGCYERFASRSVMFWAGTLLVNAVFQCCPVAADSIWLSAVNALSKLKRVMGPPSFAKSCQSLLESFYQRAVSVHPFSLKLWQSYVRFSAENGDGASVQESAKLRGFNLA